jgi:hypothetical protein
MHTVVSFCIHIISDTILKHLNCIADEIKEISYPKFVQSTLENHIKQ